MAPPKKKTFEERDSASITLLQTMERLEEALHSVRARIASMQAELATANARVKEVEEENAVLRKSRNFSYETVKV